MLLLERDHGDLWILYMESHKHRSFACSLESEEFKTKFKFNACFPMHTENKTAPPTDQWCWSDVTSHKYITLTYVN